MRDGRCPASLENRASILPDPPHTEGVKSRIGTGREVYLMSANRMVAARPWLYKVRTPLRAGEGNRRAGYSENNRSHVFLSAHNPHPEKRETP